MGLSSNVIDLTNSANALAFSVTSSSGPTSLKNHMSPSWNTMAARRRTLPCGSSGAATPADFSRGTVYVRISSRWQAAGSSRAVTRNNRDATDRMRESSGLPGIGGPGVEASGYGDTGAIQRQGSAGSRWEVESLFQFP